MLDRPGGHSARKSQGIEATNSRVTIPEFTFYRLEDDKFTEVWDHTDMDAVMRQIGQGEANR
jgi:predicted ester cyclase